MRDHSGFFTHALTTLLVVRKPATQLSFTLRQTMCVCVYVYARACVCVCLPMQYIMPLAAACFMLESDITQLAAVGGPTLCSFLVGAVGMVVGALAGWALLRGVMGPEVGARQFSLVGCLVLLEYASLGTWLSAHQKAYHVKKQIITIAHLDMSSLIQSRLKPVCVAWVTRICVCVRVYVWVSAGWQAGRMPVCVVCGWKCELRSSGKGQHDTHTHTQTHTHTHTASIYA